MSKKKQTGPIETYAVRFARKCLLEKICSSDQHHILDIEHQLLADARTTLRQHLIEDQQDRNAVKRMIRNIAIAKIMVLVEDDMVRKVVVAEIQAATFDDAFPSVN